MNISKSLPAVSVIIPTHKRPHLLLHAIESARAAGTDVEIIVVDDASVDQTSSLCQKLDGIKYVRLQRNQGVAGARNVGILTSSAERIAFLDDDDLRLPGSLDLQVEALEAEPAAGFVCGAMVMADVNYRESGEVIAPLHSGGDVFWSLLELDFPVMPLCVVIRKECFFRVGLLNKRLQGIDDWDILVRIAELYPVSILDKTVGLYRKPAPFSAQGSSAQAAHLLRAVRHQPRLLQLPRARALSSRNRQAIRRRTVNRVADTLLFNALQQLSQKEFKFVCANILAALRLNPLRAARPQSYKKLLQGHLNHLG